MVRPAGIEPAHPVPETGALSPELRARISYGLSHKNDYSIQDTPLSNKIIIFSLVNFYNNSALFAFGRSLAIRTYPPFTVKLFATGCTDRL